MSSNNELNAQEQLKALSLAQQSMEQAKGYGAKLLGTYCIILGILLGGLAAFLQLYRPNQNFGGFIIIMVVFAVAVIAMTLAYGRLYRSLPRGYSKMYLRGFALSIVLYGVSIALLGMEITNWIFMALTWLVVATPLLIAGLKMVRK